MVNGKSNMKVIHKIAIIGGTGKAGKYLIDEMLRQEIPIRVLARNPDKVSQKSQLIEIVTGSVRNYNTVQRLLTGCSAVISTLGPSRAEPDTCSVAIGHLLRVMPQLKIRRYIEVAGLGIDTPNDKKGFRTRLIGWVIKAFFSEVANDRQKGYELLSNSSINWTIVRCPMIQLTESHRTLKVNLTDSPGNKVSAADLATFLVNQVYEELYVRKCPFVAS
jgi:putative NADH-flavin reductase